MVITVANLKGGVGRSSIAINLAACFHHGGKRTLLVDADPQGSVRRWGEAANGGSGVPPVISMGHRSTQQSLHTLRTMYQFTVVDTSAGASQANATRDVLLASNLVLVPITPNATDFWAIQETLALLDSVRALRPDIQSRLVLNQADDTALCALAAKQVKTLNIEQLKATVGYRVGIAEAMFCGEGVVTWAPSSQAATEFQSLSTEVAATLTSGVTLRKGRRRIPIP